MYSRKDFGSGSSSLLKPENNDFTITSPVEIVSLDRFINTNNIYNPKILKIDVEGWEHNVLKGATNLLRQKNAPIIIIEHSNLTSSKSNNVLNSHKLITNLNEYKPHKLKYGKEIPSQLIEIRNNFDFPEHDNLFYLLPHHVKI